MLSVVLYDYADGSADKRDELRPAHRDFLASRGDLVLSGPTGVDGAVIVYEADPVELEAWLDDDPFQKAGVISRRVVTEWTVGMGSWKDKLGI